MNGVAELAKAVLDIVREPADPHAKLGRIESLVTELAEEAAVASASNPLAEPEGGDVGGSVPEGLQTTSSTVGAGDQ